MTHLITAYHLEQPHVLVALSSRDVEGTMECKDIKEARELRRGLITAFFQVSAAIRDEKRLARRGAKRG